MDGVHDLGGMHGFGPVEREENEPVFHAAWEAAVLAIQRAGGARGFFNSDEFRHGIERMAPAHYLRATYYEKWLDGVTRLLLEKGVVGAEELATRGASAASFTTATASTCSPTPTRTGWASSPSRSTACASTPASCGASRRS